MTSSYNYIKAGNPLVYTTIYPYASGSGSQPACSYLKAAPSVSITSYTNLARTDIAHMNAIQN